MVKLYEYSPVQSGKKNASTYNLQFIKIKRLFSYNAKFQSVVPFKFCNSVSNNF